MKFSFSSSLAFCLLVFAGRAMNSWASATTDISDDTALDTENSGASRRKLRSRSEKPLLQISSWSGEKGGDGCNGSSRGGSRTVGRGYGTQEYGKEPGGAGGCGSDGSSSSGTSSSGSMLEDGDLNIRFSKFEIVPGINLPFLEASLDANDYPMEEPVAEALQYATNAVSVMTSDDPVLAGEDVEGFITAAGGAPTYPNSDSRHAFWDDFRAVVVAQEERRLDQLSSDFVLPDIWENLGMTVHDVAEAVHDEYPGYWQAELIKSFVSQGVTMDYDIFPFRSAKDFVGGIIRFSELNAWATGVVAPINFRTKWIFGRPRPEEVAYAIVSEVIPNTAVPSDILTSLTNMNLGDAADFTAYDEGSPAHPSYPAMHSAASSASFWMSVVMDLSPNQYCQALRTDYAVSFARTVAGVHYPTDNIVGLNLGQEILADKLVDLLVDRYGADRTAAQKKLNDMRFNWENFDPESCNIQSTGR